MACDVSPVVMFYLNLGGRARGSLAGGRRRLTQAASEDENTNEHEHEAVMSTSADQVALQEHREAKQCLKDGDQAQEPMVGG